MQIQPGCPICGGSDLYEFNGRPKARCAGCHSLERTRLMYALLERRGRLRRGLSVLHFAPEIGLGQRLRALSSRYVPADLDIAQYQRVFPEADEVDLCADDLQRYRGEFDLVLHNHVLEHVPCSVERVLSNMASCLNPRGEMYFCTPIRRSASTDEDTSGALSVEERRKRFGQGDHMRIFGDRDVLDIFQQALGRVEQIDRADYLSDLDMKLIAAPIATGLSGGTIFVSPAASATRTSTAS